MLNWLAFVLFKLTGDDREDEHVEDEGVCIGVNEVFANAAHNEEEDIDRDRGEAEAEDSEADDNGDEVPDDEHDEDEDDE